jgi:hypothetical protein
MENIGALARNRYLGSFAPIEEIQNGLEAVNKHFGAFRTVD